MPPAAKSTRRPKTTKKAARTTRTAGADDSRDLALVIATAALEKKALAVEILDVVGKVDYADFLVLMTGRSNRQVDALAQSIEEACAKKKKRALSVEGLPAAAWVLIDFGDVVVHIFQEDARGMYDIEGLWLDAARLPVPGGNPR
jgi:ribosome-associated protein